MHTPWISRFTGFKNNLLEKATIKAKQHLFLAEFSIREGLGYFSLCKEAQSVRISFRRARALHRHTNKQLSHEAEI